MNDHDKDDLIARMAQELQDHMDEGLALPTASALIEEANTVVMETFNG